MSPPDASSTPFVNDLLDRMTVAEKVGQMVMVLNGPGWAGVSDVETLIAEHAVGSVISCAYRGLTAAEAAARNTRLQKIAGQTRLGIPLLNAGDFEQGLPSQLPGCGTDFPQQMGTGATGEGQAAERAALIAGGEERALGFHWTFSPCADVNTNPRNPVIGVRSFGGNPALVARLTERQVAGYRRARVLPTVKHFPGHGDTVLDSHRGLPVVDCGRETLDRVHLPPFRAAIAAGVGAVMTGHVVVPALDPALPATLSPRIVTGLLREEMRFGGVVVTDLMTMGAIAQHWEAGEAAVLAARAGADVIMAAGATGVAIASVEALAAAVARGRLSVDRVDGAVRRILAAKHRVGLWGAPGAEDMAGVGELLRAPHHEAFAQDLALRSITLLQNHGTLPFRSGSGATTLVAGVLHRSRSDNPHVGYTSLLAAGIRDVGRDPVLVWQAESDDPGDREVGAAVEQDNRADRLLVFTYSRDALPPGQRRLVAAMQRTGKPLAVISTGLPYDIAAFPDVGAYVATYALGFVPQQLGSPAVLRAAIDVVFGAPPGGRLPVAIPGLFARGHGLTYSRSQNLVRRDVIVSLLYPLIVRATARTLRYALRTTLFSRNGRFFRHGRRARNGRPRPRYSPREERRVSPRPGSTGR